MTIPIVPPSLRGLVRYVGLTGLAHRREPDITPRPRH